MGAGLFSYGNMASFEKSYGDGVTKHFSIPFPYLDRSHVVVSVNSAPATGYSWFDTHTIAFVTAPASGAEVLRRRVTPDETLVSFSNGSVLVEDALNIATLQALYIAEETSDLAGAADSKADVAVSVANSANTKATNATTTANAAHYLATTASTQATAAVTTANSAAAAAGAAAAAAAAAQDAAISLADSVAINDAGDLSYDGSLVGLVADNVQTAIDTIASATGVVALNSNTVTNSSTVSGANVTAALTSLNAGKANSVHSHAQSDISGLATALSDRQVTSAKNAASGYAGLDAAGILLNQLLPSRLQTTASAPPGDDWDNAFAPGHYTSATASHSPVASGTWINVFPLGPNSNWNTQIAIAFTSASGTDTRTWRRQLLGGSWDAWYRVRMSETEINAMIAAVGDTKVPLAGNATIIGVKTFTSIPIGPAVDPVTDNQLARKAYVDAAVASKVTTTGGFSTIPVTASVYALIKVVGTNVAAGASTLGSNLALGPTTAAPGLAGTWRNDSGAALTHNDRGWFTRIS